MSNLEKLFSPTPFLRPTVPGELVQFLTTAQQPDPLRYCCCTPVHNNELYRVYSVLCLVSWTVAAEDADLENGYGGGGKGAEAGGGGGGRRRPPQEPCADARACPSVLRALRESPLRQPRAAADARARLAHDVSVACSPLTLHFFKFFPLLS